MTRKPVILQVIPHLETGGAELSTLEIVDALNKVGATPLVVTEGGRMASDVERLGGEIIAMPAASKNPVQMLRNKKFLEQLISQRDVQLLHARSRAPAWSALLATSSIRIPFVTTYHGAYGEKGPVKRVYNSIMARGDIVIANSQYTAELVRSRHKTEERRMRIVYRGVDIQKFKRDEVSLERQDALRAAWGIDRECKIILHPARLTRWKGQNIVIKAMKKLIETRKQQKTGDMPGIVAILAGDHQGREEYLNELRREIERLDLGSHVLLVGHCQDMAAACALAHVAIIASVEPEAFGRTSAEAQAIGCPVIATNIGAPRETVCSRPFVRRSETTGWLVPPNDSDELANALGEVLDMEPAAYDQLAGRAIENVVRNFSDDLMKAQTLAIYDELLGTDFAGRYERVSKLAASGGG